MHEENMDRFGRTKLHYVAADLPQEQHADEVARLVRAGCDPNAQDKQGWTPLHFAAQEWSEGSGRTLLDNGAIVDATDGQGNTPLGRAVLASQGRGEVIQLLLHAGADPDKENAAGISPRALAARIANYDIAELFEEKA
jgi:uncharacterized protein